MKVLCWLLLALHGFVGIGALAGGLAAITNPNEPLGVTVEALKNSPFSNFLIPAIILFKQRLFSAGLILNFLEKQEI